MYQDQNNTFCLICVISTANKKKYLINIKNTDFIQDVPINIGIQWQILLCLQFVCLSFDHAYGCNYYNIFNCLEDENSSFY